MRSAIGLALGLTLGLAAACDDDPPPETTCVDWLRCYVDCRDGQHAAGDNDLLPQEDLHRICLAQCMEIRGEVKDFPLEYELALQNPDDVGFFWESTSLCISDGA